MSAQSLTALQRANAIRIERGHIKARIKSGEVTIEEVIDSPALASMQVGALLRAQPRWGRSRSLRFLNRVVISESRQVGALTDRQRRIFLAALAEIRDRVAA